MCRRDLAFRAERGESGGTKRVSRNEGNVGFETRVVAVDPAALATNTRMTNLL